MKKSIIFALSFLLVGTLCFAENITNNSKNLLTDKNQKNMFAELKDDLEQVKQANDYAAFEAMQKSVEAAYYGFTGYRCDFYEIPYFKCKTIKMYYRHIPSAIYYLEDSRFSNNTMTVFQKFTDNEPTYVDCFIEGREKPVPLVAPIYTISVKSCFTDAGLDKGFSNNIYEVDKTVLTSIIARKGALDGEQIRVFKDPILRPNMSDMKKIGERKSLPKKHLQTFKLEDYK